MGTSRMLPAPDDAPEFRAVRFGVYEFRFDTLTLSKYGLKIKLQEQPSRVLALLLQSAGQIVTRESLKQELWPDSSFGEFDSGLNTALSKVRSALSDSGLRPTFIERVPRQGYRFIAPILDAAPPGPQPRALPRTRAVTRTYTGDESALAAVAGRDRRLPLSAGYRGGRGTLARTARTLGSGQQSRALQHSSSCRPIPAIGDAGRKLGFCFC